MCIIIIIAKDKIYKQFFSRIINNLKKKCFKYLLLFKCSFYIMFCLLV